MFNASAKSISFIQLLSALGVVAGIFLFDFTLTNFLLIFAGYFIFSCLGMSITMHRYLSHKSFAFKNPLVEKMFLIIAVLAGRGSPIGWVYVHRMHHRYSDTEQDPHDPRRITWRVFFPHLLNSGHGINKRVVIDLLTKEQVAIDRYYLLFIIAWSIMLCLVSVEFFYFFYIIPLFLTYISMTVFVIMSHAYGYRTFQTKDSSKNTWFISLILWGEGWHNNHHANPGEWKTQVKSWELDISAFVIKLVKA